MILSVDDIFSFIRFVAAAEDDSALEASSDDMSMPCLANRWFLRGVVEKTALFRPLLNKAPHLRHFAFDASDSILSKCDHTADHSLLSIYNSSQQSPEIVT